jgi:hypothetical protein
VVVVDDTDALNFNNLVISAEGATNPIVKNYQCCVLNGNADAGVNVLTND